MELVSLDRFVLGEFLGSGSDYEAYAATDLQTGVPAVLKRPNPDYIERGMHAGVDRLSEQLVEVHQGLDGSVPHLAKLIGYTENATHGTYFGDSPAGSYRVLVQERARGIPLVCDIRDKFKGVPIGLPQNLFALHPLLALRLNGEFALHQQLVDVEEAFQKSGHLVLDLRPQNVYFDPGEGSITLIDIGTMPSQGVASQGTASLGGQAKDVHDFYAEVFTFYASPEAPPTDVKRYGEAYGIRSVPDFDQRLNDLVQRFQQADSSRVKDAAVSILNKIKARVYASFAEFRQDFDGYLSAVAERNVSLPDIESKVDVWKQASLMLSGPYWRRFLFDPDTQLPYH